MEKKVMNRWLVVVGAILIQLALGAIYAWSVFTPALKSAGWSKLETQIVFAVGLATFAGVAVYRTEFDLPGAGYTLLDLGRVHDISEVTLNGTPLGLRWWGRHRYDAKGAFKKGRNILEIKVTTTLFNYCQSLKDNPTAARWTKGKKAMSTGLVGPVRLHKSE